MIVANSIRTLSVSNPRCPPRGIDQKPGLERARLTRSAFNPPITPVCPARNEPRPSINTSSRVLRSPRQHRVKTRPVNMPSRAVGVEDKIVVVQILLPPSRADGEGG